MTFQLDPGTPALVENFRRQLSRGYGMAIAEHIKGIARRCDDVERLRALIGLLADHVMNPPKLKRGAPPKKNSAGRSVRVVDGTVTITIDMDAIIPKTKAEQRQELNRLIFQLGVQEEVARIRRRKSVTLRGAILEAARTLKITEPQARKAYYGRNST